MLRGFVTTKCPYCGHIFRAPDIEYNATVLSMPVRCRNCGNTFSPRDARLDEDYPIRNKY